MVANRLSEHPLWRILLLEAGTEETTSSDVPAFAVNLQQGPLDWQFRAEPQHGGACLGLVDGHCNFPRGKVLGGTSAINYMMYTRGNRGDYDGWESQGEFLNFFILSHF